jgi:hypothetical protein
MKESSDNLELEVDARQGTSERINTAPTENGVVAAATAVDVAQTTAVSSVEKTPVTSPTSESPESELNWEELDENLEKFFEGHHHFHKLFFVF